MPALAAVLIFAAARSLPSGAHRDRAAHVSCVPDRLLPNARGDIVARDHYGGRDPVVLSLFALAQSGGSGSDVVRRVRGEDGRLSEAALPCDARQPQRHRARCVRLPAVRRRAHPPDAPARSGPRAANGGRAAIARPTVAPASATVLESMRTVAGGAEAWLACHTVSDGLAKARRPIHGRGSASTCDRCRTCTAHCARACRRAKHIAASTRRARGPARAGASSAASAPRRGGRTA